MVPADESRYLRTFFFNLRCIENVNVIRESRDKDHVSWKKYEKNSVVCKSIVVN